MVAIGRRTATDTLFRELRAELDSMGGMHWGYIYDLIDEIENRVPGKGPANGKEKSGCEASEEIKE